MKNNYYTTEEFEKKYKSYSKKIKGCAFESLSKFILYTEKKMPYPQGLHYEKLQLPWGYWSIKVGRQYRIILYYNKKDSSHVFLWLDKHDEAYEWANKKVFSYEQEKMNEFWPYNLERREPELEEKFIDVNPYYIPQIIEKKPAKGLFENLDSELLLDYGIPDNLIENVQFITTYSEFYRLREIISEPSYLFLRNYLVNVARSGKTA